MMEFLKTLTAAAAFLSLALLFLPRDEGLRRGAQTVFSLLFLLLLLPRDGSFSFEELIPSPESYPDVSAGEEYEDTLSYAVVAGITSDLVDRFSLDPDALHIQTDITLTQEAASGTYLHLSLGRKNFFADATQLLRYVKNTYSVECEVRYVGN
jgi:hypothetical protein